MSKIKIININKNNQFCLIILFSILYLSIFNLVQDIISLYFSSLDDKILVKIYKFYLNFHYTIYKMINIHFILVIFDMF
jgi:hypothetical protein